MVGRSFDDLVGEVITQLCTANERNVPVFNFRIEILGLTRGKFLLQLGPSILGHKRHQLIKRFLTDPIHIVGIRQAVPVVEPMTGGVRINRVAQVPLMTKAAFSLELESGGHIPAFSVPQELAELLLQSVSGTTYSCAEREMSNGV